MIIHKAYLYRLKDNQSRTLLLAQAGGCCRFVWNRALALQKQRLDEKVKLLTFSELCCELTLWKKQPELSFLKEVHSQPLQQTLKNLDRAIWEALTKKKGFPRFKKKFCGDSFRYPQGCKVEGARIFLPKIGWMSFFHSVNPEGEIKNVSVSRRGKHWFVSVQTEYEEQRPEHPSKLMIGVDVGISRFATLSNGWFYEPLNSFRKLENKLSMEQKKLSRKKKFSNNWRKQKYRIAQIHIKIANARHDFLHKLSTELSKNHAAIVIEDLKVSQMSQSAKGTLDRPGNGVKKKSSLNKSILDQGWYEFRRQLEYKQQWRGGELIVVPPQYTSQTCPCCGYICADNRKTQAIFQCVDCGYLEHADIVGAKNILAVGQTVPACESNLIRGRKQELAETVRKCCS